MNAVYIIRFGEIFIKGKNRRFFENSLHRNINKTLKHFGITYKLKTERGRFLILEDTDTPLKTAEILSKIPGLVSVSIGLQCNKDIIDIGEKALQLIKMDAKLYHSFKVESKRADKTFPLTSPEICIELGGYLLENGINLPVDVHNPDLKIGVEILIRNAYVYCTTLKGAGGLPVGVSGRVALMLSGGIDSPVAGYFMQKRGAEIVPIYFHGFPFTSDRVKEKIINLSEKLAFYQGKIHLKIINFTPILMELKKLCPEKLIIIMMRRFMVRVAERIAADEKCMAVVTGDNLGQVASQTLDNMQCITDASNLMILRPLLGFDKVDIVNISKNIGTYNISIEPFEDCCSLFVPKFPEIYGKVEELREAEKVFNIEELVDEVMRQIETISIGGQTHE